LFELSLALKYLIPKKRSVATALISLVSVTVISLVVWLVLVFLSVTSGIEKNWVSKFTALQAPLRISPTDEYYRSYYYQIDHFAAASNYTVKTIGEKAVSPGDPYAPDKDIELPAFFPKKESINPVQGALRAMDGLCFQDFEIGGALLKLHLQREGRSTWLSQMSFLLSIADKNPRFSTLLLPNTLPLADDTILLPKSYLDSGVALGDTGFLSYTSAPSSQEQRIPIRVAGFYDPGFMSMGNRCVLVPAKITRMIHSAVQTTSPDGTPVNGFFVWGNVSKPELVARFEKAGISKYWKIASYDEYESARDLLAQFRSDRLLFTLVGGIVLLVACCNVISMLILLVNDKKKEIAVLQALGAKKSSVALIFGACGLTVGVLSTMLGTLLAYVTLRNIDTVVSVLSSLQGRTAFNPMFFGQQLPHTLSPDALTFVLIATPVLSLLAGLVPALRATRLQPATVLRSE